MCTLTDLAVEHLNELIKKDKLKAWRQAQELLSNIKTIEMELRKEILSDYFTETKTGTNKCDVAGGQLVYTKKYTTSVDEKVFDEVAKQAALLGVDIGSVFKVTHDLNKREYKKLNEEQRSVIDKTLTTKLSSPVLEFKADSE